MLLACLDDSGSEDQRGMVVGGVITDFEAWRTLADKWPRLLRRYDLLEFHMSKLGNYTKGWRRRKRKKMMAEFVKAVLNLRGQVVAAGVDLSDFKKIREDYGWKKWDPMLLCLEHALQMCRTYAESENDTFALLLDRLKPGAAGRVARLMTLYRRQVNFGDRFKRWRDESRLECQLLQAADLAACASFRHLNKFFLEGDNVAREELNALYGLSFREPRLAYLDDENLRPIAEAQKNRADNRRLFSIEACEPEWHEER